jgi:DNA-binding transcriptional regulator YdaS (Cro superfamily)
MKQTKQKAKAKTKPKTRGAAIACQAFGGSPTLMAAAINAAGKHVTRQSLEKQVHGMTSLSAQFVPEVASMTGIPKAKLNPEVDWELAKETP